MTNIIQPYVQAGEQPAQVGRIQLAELPLPFIHQVVMEMHIYFIFIYRVPMFLMHFGSYKF